MVCQLEELHIRLLVFYESRGGQGEGHSSVRGQSELLHRRGAASELVYRGGAGRAVERKAGRVDAREHHHVNTTEGYVWVGVQHLAS